MTQSTRATIIKQAQAPTTQDLLRLLQHTIQALWPTQRCWAVFLFLFQLQRSILLFLSFLMKRLVLPDAPDEVTVLGTTKTVFAKVDGRIHFWASDGMWAIGNAPPEEAKKKKEKRREREEKRREKKNRTRAWAAVTMTRKEKSDWKLTCLRRNDCRGKSTRVAEEPARSCPKKNITKVAKEMKHARVRKIYDGEADRATNK